MVLRMNDQYFKNLVVSLGGMYPGLCLYDMFEQRLIALLELEQGHSVYALDITDDRAAIAAGTKRGYIIYGRRPDAVEQTFRTERFFTASPILSAKFIDPDTIAASDISGQIILWHLEDNTQTRVLDTCREPVCSLFAINSRLLGGLTICGNIYLWDLTGSEYPVYIKGVPIPVIYSLVNVIKFHDCWAWPSQSGCIVLFNAHSQQMELLKAHIGTVYALCTWDGHLISLGKSDGSLKFWNLSSDQPVKSVQLAAGAISASVWRQQQLRCFMINENGRGCVFDIDQNDNISANNLEGDSFRTVYPPEHSYIEKRLSENKTGRIEQLSSEIKCRINSGDFACLDPLYQQLEQLGSREIVLWLSAYQAEKQNDLYGQINCCHQLYQILDPKQRRSVSFLSKYIKALIRCLHLQRAVSLIEENNIADKLSCEQIDYSKLCEQSEILSQQCCIIDQSEDLKSILQSCELLDNSTGALLVCAAAALHEIEYLIDFSEFSSKYHDYRNHNNPKLPEAETSQLYWFRDQQCRQLDSIVLGLPDPDIKCIIRFETQYSKTKITTVTALDIQGYIQKNNERPEDDIDSKIDSALKYLKDEGSILSAIKNIAQQYKTMAKSAANLY